jgi:hypothetical protein
VQERDGALLGASRAGALISLASASALMLINLT